MTTDPQGREIEFAPQVALEQYEDIAYDILENTLGIKGAWISDESSLDDFNFEVIRSCIVRDREGALKKIKERYGVDVSDVEGLNLVKICERISILGNLG